MEIDLRFIGFVESNITRGGLTIFIMDSNLFAAGRQKPFLTYFKGVLVIVKRLSVLHPAKRVS